MVDHNYLHFKGLEQDDVVVVLGATHGDFIREHRNEILQKNVLVVNVEPTLEGVINLTDYIRRNMPENAIVFSTAVADYPTTMSMDIRDNLITSTLQNRPETNERWPMRLLYQQKTAVVTLDTILETLPKVDKLFMDIEGSELEVVKFSQHIWKIPYIAIAAYHVRDGQQTHIPLRETFSPVYRVEVTDAPSRNPGEVVFFAIKE